MDTCLNNSTQIGTSGYRFDQFIVAYRRNLVCGVSQYLRPDEAGALLPYLFSIGIIVVHAPVLWERIHDWEKVQMISLCLAAFNITITVAGYWSSRLEPSHVLVWMPLTSSLDAGAMLQLVLLIFEKDGGWEPIRRAALQSLPQWIVQCFGRAHPRKTEQRENQAAAPVFEADTDTEDDTDTNTDTDDAQRKRARVVIVAFILLLAILILQIVGLAFAIKGRRQPDLKVAFCSPSLDNTAVSVFNRNAVDPTTNCGTWYDISVSAHKGIGCLNIPAKRQRDWLLITIVVLPFSLVFQCIDLFILLFGSSGHGQRDLRRPWLTMFFGIVILIALAIASYQHSVHLPDGVSESMLIFRHDPTTDSFGMCVGLFHAAALRGSILAWIDGTLWFLKSIYLGQ